MNQPSITFNDKTYTLDRHGFLDPHDQWDENFAEGIAAKLGILGGLSEQHWKFIRYLRSKFLDEDTVPVIVKACSDNQLRLSELRALFPTGYHRGACKIAGINFAYMCKTNLWLTYETPPPVEVEHDVDELGFLKDAEAWNERFVLWVSEKWSLPDGVTDRHWRVIHYLRDYFHITGTIPTVYEACSANGLDLETLHKLFPGGFRRGACRAAGLPFFG
jgi:tRNA 2-thiouridine synthesizing protein E